VLAFGLLALGCREDAESPTSPSPAPALATAAGALSFTQVRVGGGPTGGDHSCGVTTDDRAYCWGHNYLGQLGDGTNDPHLLPVPVAGP